MRETHEAGKTSEEIVKAKWPDAECVKQAFYGFQIVRKKTCERLSGFRLESLEAWADAASRLEE